MTVANPDISAGATPQAAAPAADVTPRGLGDASPPPVASGSTPPPAAAASGTAPSWKDSLPEELRNDPSLKNYAEISDLAKGFVSAQKMVGAEKFVVPGKNATDQDWKAVYSKLGLPESVEKYELPPIQNADPQLLGGFKKVAHEAGILPSQAVKVLGFYEEINKQALAAQNVAQLEEINKGDRALKGEWGAAYEQNFEIAKRGYNANSSEGMTELFNKLGIDKHPEVIKHFHALGMALKEDGFNGEGGGTVRQFSPGEARAQIGQVMGDKNHPYMNADHPNHKAAVDEMNKLHQMANRA